MLKSLGLRQQFIAGLALVSVVAALVTNGALLKYEYDMRLQALEQEITAVEASTLPALEAAVWALDQGQTERLARSLFALPDVHSVEVAGNGIRTIRLGNTTVDRHTITHTRALNHALDSSLQGIGQLTINVSLSSARADLAKRAAALLVSNSLHIAIVLLCCAYLLQQLYSRRIGAATRTLNHTVGEQPGALQPAASRNELDELQNAAATVQRHLSQERDRHNEAILRLQALTHNNPEIIWRCDLPQPVNLKLPPQQQASAIIETAQLGYMNAAARDLAERANKGRLSELPFIEPSLIEWATQNHYHAKDVITQCKDKNGETRYFRNSLACWIEHDHLRCIWGIAIDITQSLTTQKALEQREQQLYLSQTRLSEAQALAHMGHWSYYTREDKLQVSDEFARIYGFDPEGPTPTWDRLFKRVHPEDQSYVAHVLSDPRTQAAGAEHRIIWPSGELRFVQAIARKNVTDERVESTFGILIDITDRRRAEEERSKSQRALAESEARLAQAQAIAHMGHWLLDCETRTLICSDELYRLLGLVPQERQLDQAGFMEHIHPDDHTLIEHLLNSAQDESFTNEFRVIRTDQTERFMRGTFTPFYAGGKSTPRIFGIMMDVTEQKHAELELRASQELFATAFDSSPDGIFFVESHHGRFIKVNHALAKMLHTSEGELLRQQFDQLPAHVDDAGASHIASLVARHNSATNVEVVLECAHGEKVNGLLSWQRVTIAQKPCVLGVIHDVTPLRRLQKTAHEQQQQLVQADKLASIGTMVAGVAHEINNPNHLIQMNADLLEGFYQPIMEALGESRKDIKHAEYNGLSLEELRETVPELLADVRMSSQRINRIVSDLKDFARPQENSEYLITDLNAVVGKTLNLLSTLIEKQPINFHAQLAEDIPPILADSQRLEQVLVNLIMNALEASRAGDNVYIRTRYSEAEHSIFCEVEDQGCGISEENLQRIFDPFYTTKQDKGGTGLGLAISYRLIQEHGGTLSAHAVKGRGTTMTICLPPATQVDTSPEEPA